MFQHLQQGRAQATEVTKLFVLSKRWCHSQHKYRHFKPCEAVLTTYLVPCLETACWIHVLSSMGLTESTFLCSWFESFNISLPFLNPPITLWLKEKKIIILSLNSYNGELQPFSDGKCSLVVHVVCSICVFEWQAVCIPLVLIYGRRFHSVVVRQNTCGRRNTGIDAFFFFVFAFLTKLFNPVCCVKILRTLKTGCGPSPTRFLLSRHKR